jgi:stage III sporulation protein AF
MDFIRNWLAGIVAAGLLSAVAQALTPQGAPRKVTRLVCGLLMMAALVRPLLSLDTVNFDLPSLVSAQVSNGFPETRDDHTKALIEGQTATYIETRLAARNVSARVAVTAMIPDTGGFPLPYAAVVDSGGRISEGERIDLTIWIAESIGIPPHRQTIR